MSVALRRCERLPVNFQIHTPEACRRQGHGQQHIVAVGLLPHVNGMRRERLPVRPALLPMLAVSSKLTASPMSTFLISADYPGCVNDAPDGSRFMRAGR